MRNALPVVRCDADNETAQQLGTSDGTPGAPFDDRKSVSHVAGHLMEDTMTKPDVVSKPFAVIPERGFL